MWPPGCSGRVGGKTSSWAARYGGEGGMLHLAPPGSTGELPGVTKWWCWLMVHVGSWISLAPSTINHQSLGINHNHVVHSCWLIIGNDHGTGNDSAARGESFRALGSDVGHGKIIAMIHSKCCCRRCDVCLLIATIDISITSDGWCRWPTLNYKYTCKHLWVMVEWIISIHSWSFLIGDQLNMDHINMDHINSSNGRVDWFLGLLFVLCISWKWPNHHDLAISTVLAFSKTNSNKMGVLSFKHIFYVGL